MPPPHEASWWRSLPGPAERTRFRGAEGAGGTVVATCPLPPGASWRTLNRWSVDGRRTQVVTLILLSLVAGAIGLFRPAGEHIRRTPTRNMSDAPPPTIPHVLRSPKATPPGC